MSNYSIKELEQLSGIKAHTLRVWERRYGILQPNRSDTNIRSYSDKELRKLLNINTLIEHGWKISKISKLQEDQFNNEIQSIFEKTGVGSSFISYVNGLTVAMLEFDEASFEKIFSTAVLRFGLKKTMTDIIEMHPRLEMVSFGIQNLAHDELKEYGAGSATNVTHGNVIQAIIAVTGRVGWCAAWYILQSVQGFFRHGFVFRSSRCC